VLRRLPLVNPENRFASQQIEYDPGERPELGLTLYEDKSKSILSKNDSPDIPFRYSLNAYRGCAHGCAYCYARPSHEFLGFGSGADFERRIVYKPRAAELLRETFEKRSWQGELIVVSGNTDAYQPVEKQLELTRACLLVCAAYRNPVHIITRSALIERDLDVLARLRDEASIGVSVSVTFWDEAAARAVEPYAPPPRRRIETIRRLSQAGIPVVVHVAPVLPGLSDCDMIPILTAARDAGAVSAMMMPVRLPGSVAEVFTERIREAFPQRADKILARILEMRDGKLNEPAFHARFRAKGRYASALEATFRATCTRLGYQPFPEPQSGTFKRPTAPSEQLKLFS
jgi:DNA repair photolyase